MRRNLFSVSRLHDGEFDCLFGKKQCLITFNDEVVGRAFMHDKIYLLSIKDSINVVSSENDVNVAKRSIGILEIIHTDIFDPFPIASVDGYNSFIIFTDDYSRYEYIYLIKERSKCLDKFKIFKAEVKN
jgi:hypothetical protein